MKTTKTFAVLLLAACTLGFLSCDSKNDPNNPLSKHPFYVSATKRVVFSPGNLQYQASTNTWRFAKHQYNYVGEKNWKISPTYGGWIDLFGWGTGDNPTKTSINDADYSTFTDWGKNKIDDYAVSTWRTLTVVEWRYLFDSHDYNYATVAETAGVIIYPDDYVSPTDVEKNKKGYYWEETYTGSEWEKMEQAGAVFLPCAGWRDDDGSIYSGLRYWSSTGYRDNSAGCVQRTYEDGFILFNSGTKVSKLYGCSVRLVKDYR